MDELKYSKRSDAWLVVCSRTGARIFTFENHNLRLLKEIDDPCGRLRNREFTSDKPGQSRAKFRGSATPHRLVKETKPHDQEGQQFARKLDRELRRAFLNHESDEFTIVAEPRFMGFMRSQMAESKMPIQWIGKDLGHFSDSDIAKHFGRRPRGRRIVS